VQYVGATNRHCDVRNDNREKIDFKQMIIDF